MWYTRITCLSALYLDKDAVLLRINANKIFGIYDNIERFASHSASIRSVKNTFIGYKNISASSNYPINKYN